MRLPEGELACGRLPERAPLPQKAASHPVCDLQEASIGAEASLPLEDRTLVKA
jgi:hypothetical protein